MEILFLIIGLTLGFIIAFLFFKEKQKSGVDTSALDSKIVGLEKDLSYAEKEKLRLNSEKDNLLNEMNSSREELNAANITIAKAREAFKSQEEKFTTLKSELENVHKKYSTEFENIANKILDEKSQKFTDQNKANMDIILNPLKDNIKRFEEQVQKSYKTDSDERITLKTEIKMLMDLNTKISEEANNLTKALKGDNKMQGNWGEHILENIFERSGLIKDQEYKKESSTTNEDGGRSRPDFTVMLPDNKHIVVDSKVSLVAYEKFVNANDQQEKEKYIKEHILSIRNHIKGLSERNYQSISNIDSPDFVLLFIPIESSFGIAVQADLELFSFAWDKKVVVVSPSTLLATLRTIASIWKQERQNKNVAEIARQAGGLYDKFVGFLEDMSKIEKSIDDSGKAYQNAISKLNSGSGNIVKRVENLKILGAKTDKSIPAKFIENDEQSQLTEEPEAQ